MSKRNAHDFRCAQEVAWLNRDAPDPEPTEARVFTPGVVHRRGETTTRVTTMAERNRARANEVRERLGLPLR